MLPFRLSLKTSQIAEVKNFTDNNKATIFGLTYAELCELFDVNTEYYVSEDEYNNGKGFLDNGIYGNCYYRHWCPAKAFTTFGMRVLHYSIFNKKAYYKPVC